MVSFNSSAASNAPDWVAVRQDRTPGSASKKMSVVNHTAAAQIQSPRNVPRPSGPQQKKQCYLAGTHWSDAMAALTCSRNVARGPSPSVSGISAHNSLQIPSRSACGQWGRMDRILRTIRGETATSRKSILKIIEQPDGIQQVASFGRSFHSVRLHDKKQSQFSSK